MKKYGLIAAVIILLPWNILSLLGQKSTIIYDLSSYSLPDLRRKTLEFQFNLSQNQNYSNQRSVNDTSHYHYSNFSSDLNPTYTYYLNLKKVQVESNTSFNPLDFGYSRNYSSNSNDTNPYSSYYYTNVKNKNSTYNPYINYNGEHRYYYKKKFFIEADINAKIEYNWNSNADQTKNPEYKTTQNSLNSHISIPTLVGWGRIERVEDARLAIYILDDLKKHNRLKREVNHDEITGFAQFLSKLKNERFFDSREKKIWEIQQIDSFMIANNLVTENDAVFFTLVNDNWNYAALPVREAGFRISGGISNGLSSSVGEKTYIDTITLTYHNSTINYNFQFLGKLVYEKPIKLYWQIFINDIFETGPTYYNETSDSWGTNNKSKLKNYNITNTLNAGIGYYPNSRTDISMSFNLNNGYSHRTDQSENINDASNETFFQSFSTGLQLTGYYYLSPQLQMTLNTGINHYYSKDEAEVPDVNTVKLTNSSNVYFNLGVTYKIL